MNPPNPKAQKLSVYGETDVAYAALGAKNYAKEIGFSLDDIKVLLDGLSPDSPPSERWQSIAEARLPEVERLIQRAQMMKEILETYCD